MASSPNRNALSAAPEVGNWIKITVIMLDRHIADLDRLAIDMRLKHGRAISMAEIIRGLIEAAFQSGVDLSGADGHKGIADLLNAGREQGG